MQRENDDKIPIPNHYICPITQRIMNDPVSVGDQIFERLGIEQWFDKNRTCPLTRNPLKPPWDSHTELRQEIENFLIEYPHLNHPDHRVTDQECLIHAISRNNCTEILRLAAKPQNVYCLINTKNSNGENSLHIMCQYGSSEQVQQLIKALGNLALSFAAAESNSKMNALHYACMRGESDMVSHVIEALGIAAVDAALAENDDGWNALALTCLKWRYNVAVLDLVTKALGDKDQLEYVIKLLGNKVQAAALAKNANQENALHIALASDFLEYIEVIELVIETLGDKAQAAALAL